MLEATCQRAEDILLDRRVFILSDAQWQTFLAALDAPAHRAAEKPLEHTRSLGRMTPAPDPKEPLQPPAKLSAQNNVEDFCSGVEVLEIGSNSVSYKMRSPALLALTWFVSAIG